MPTTRPFEISLFSKYYPIIGTVKISAPTQFAQKQVIGDYTKDSEQYTSSLVFSDHRGGIGIKDMVEQKDFDRCDWSTCELGFKGHLILPPLLTNATNPTTAATDCIILIEYNNLLYACFGTDVRTWSEGSASWSSSIKTLSGTPTDAIVHKSKLYFAVGTDFERYDGSAWTTGAVLSGAVVASRYFCEWNDSLFILNNSGALKYSTNEGVTFTASATSTLEAGSFNSLFVSQDRNEATSVYMGTKTGLYLLDYTNAKWLLTGLVYPSHDFGGTGATTWRDKAFIPVGMGIYQYEPTGTPAVITPMGLDRDYGVPSTLRGSIIKVLGEHNALFACIDATVEQTRTLFLGSYILDSVFYDNQGSSAVMKWSGEGWSVIYLSGTADEALKCATVCSADGNYRLWFAIDRTVYYTPLNSNLQNPLEITNYTYGSTCTHDWPWFDADNSVIDKTAFSVSAYVEGTSATEYIKLYYGTDYSGTWTLLTNTTFTDGQIDANGQADFTFASGAGLSFKAIRFRAILYRGSTTTLSPDLRWLRLKYMKILDPQYNFEVVVDCTRDYRHQRAGTLVGALKTNRETDTMGAFVFRTFPNGTDESYNVKLVSFEAVTEAGRHKEGLYKVGLVAL